jgi:hypothetical protein
VLSKLDFEDVEGKIRHNGDSPVTYVKVRVEYLDTARSQND